RPPWNETAQGRCLRSSEIELSSPATAFLTRVKHVLSIQTSDFRVMASSFEISFFVRCSTGISYLDVFCSKCVNIIQYNYTRKLVEELNNEPPQFLEVFRAKLVGIAIQTGVF